MHVAIIQLQVELADKAANFSRVQRLVEKAMAMAATPDIIVLPELWSTGYALKDLPRLASSNGDEEAEFLGELARSYKVWFAGGSVAAMTDKGISNRAQIIDRKGRLQKSYDKVHLVPMLEEDKYLLAGDSSCICTIEEINFGFAICYDIRFCQYLHKLALEGAEVLIVSAQWPLARINHWQTLLTARAIENQYYVVAANNKASGTTNFGGNSMAVQPDGEIICQLQKSNEIEVVHLDPSLVRNTRERIPVFKDRRPELY